MVQTATMRSSNMQRVNNSSRSSCLPSLCQLCYFMLKHRRKKKKKKSIDRLLRVQYVLCFKGRNQCRLALTPRRLDRTLAGASHKRIWLYCILQITTAKTKSVHFVWSDGKTWHKHTPPDGNSVVYGGKGSIQGSVRLHLTMYSNIS